MLIKTESHDITVSSVVSTTIRRDGKSYPALKFVFSDEITAEDLAALSSGEIEIEGNMHEGYTTLGEISAVIGKITSSDDELNALVAEFESAKAEHAEYKSTVDSILPLLDDEVALSAMSLFPTWEAGKSYAVGDRLVYGGAMYKVVQAHTSQSDWTPEAAASLFERIDETHAGTLDDPIPYEGNMALENGKYYSQNGIIYLCNRDTGNPVYNTLAELVGLYVEKAE